MLQTTNRKILIDTGVNINQDAFWKSLNEAGCTAEDIDIVMFTHLHYDHTGLIISVKK